MIQWSVFRSRRSVIQWILVQSGFHRSLIWKWICSKGTPQTRNPDPHYFKGTHPKVQNAIVKNVELNGTLLKSWLLRNITLWATLLNYGKCSLPMAMRSKILWSFLKSHLYRLLIQRAVKEVLAHRIELRMLWETDWKLRCAHDHWHWGATFQGLWLFYSPWCLGENQQKN